MISERKIEVRYGETDQMGVVYHANYVIWCELGRTKFFSDLGFNIVDLENQGLLFPIREINLTYLKPCRYGEDITIHTSVKEFSAVKTVYYHEIKCQDELRVKGTTTLVCVNKSDFSVARLDKSAKAVYDAYKKLVK